MQGAYRIAGQDGEFVESFVAAPGPMGWRYFSHVHPPDEPERDRYTVDLVTDLDWNLVRFRLAATDGWRAVVTRTDSGLEVVHGTQDAERVDPFDDVTAVWSASPATLLVIHRRFGGGKGGLRAVRIERGERPAPVDVSLAAAGGSRVATVGGEGEAERVRVIVDGQEFDALIRADLPLRAEGWFELIA
jgi:hypothetical protein